MSDSERLDTIEIKLAHLERSLLELGQTVMHQQREITVLAAHNRALRQQLQELDNAASPSANPFEKPPHY
jgi:uncharacterized coiled-coil protein SlyX